METAWKFVQNMPQNWKKRGEENLAKNTIWGQIFCFDVRRNEKVGFWLSIHTNFLIYDSKKLPKFRAGGTIIVQITRFFNTPY